MYVINKKLVEKVAKYYGISKKEAQQIVYQCEMQNELDELIYELNEEAPYYE